MSPFLALAPAGSRRPLPRPTGRRGTTLAISAVAMFVAASGYSPPASAEPSSRPNIVLIMADDIGYECYGCYGSTQYQTPRIDRLAREGMLFRHCFSQPLCTPSRVKLMTGLSNVRNYVAFSMLRKDQRTIGHFLQQAGYRTLVAGKWQLYGSRQYSERFRGRGVKPEEAGFDEHCLWQVDELGSRYWKPRLRINGENREFGDAEYGPAIVSDHIRQFITKNRDRPFFVYYPMILVHNPFEPTPDSPDGSPAGRTAAGQRNFEDMVAYMDRIVGEITAHIDQLGLAEKTLVLVTGDNGTNTQIRSQLNGRTIQGGKGKMTDAGTRVALVARWPGTIAAGAECDDLVDFSDFLPTLMSAAGETPPPAVDGRSFLPQLRGEPGNPREWLYSYYFPRPEKGQPRRSARDKRFRLYDDGSFFDVTRDVLEQHNLQPAELSPEAAEARRKLQRALDSFPAEGQALLQFDSGQAP